MSRARIREGFMPWAGLALGTLGAGLAHQLGAESTFQNCATGSPLLVIIATIIGLVLIGIGAAGSWRIFSADGEGSTRRFVAAVSVMACAIYAIAVILPFIAAMVIPRCWS